MKGAPVTGFEKGKIYVVEFWATWCPPCRKSIPHLTELAHKHKGNGVTIIGVDSSGRDTLEKVQAFVTKMGDQMDYTVAWDTFPNPKGGGTTGKDWMAAAKQDGIPCAFIVGREGKIVWIGNPLQYFGSVLDDVVADKFDPAAQTKIEASSEILMESYIKAARAQEWDKAIKAVDEYGALHRENAAQAETMKFRLLLNGKKDYAAAYVLGNTLVTGAYKDDAQQLNAMAWQILDDKGIEQRDNELAYKAATRAAELTKHEDGMILDTLARAYFEKGDTAKAIEWQTKAIEKTTDEEMKKEMTEALEKYKSKK